MATLMNGLRESRESIIERMSKASDLGLTTDMLKHTSAMRHSFGMRVLVNVDQLVYRDWDKNDGELVHFSTLFTLWLHVFNTYCVARAKANNEYLYISD